MMLRVRPLQRRANKKRALDWRREINNFSCYWSRDLGEMKLRADRWSLVAEFNEW